MKTAAAMAALTIVVGSGLFNSVWAQTADIVYNDLEVRLQSRAGSVAYVRVRLLLQSSMQPVAESISRPEGQVRFNRLKEGEYLVQTFESDMLEATETNVSIHPADPEHPRPQYVTIFVDLPKKQKDKDPEPSVIKADVDIEVPKDARKRYDAGMKASIAGDYVRAIKELQAATEKYPNYYSARIELGSLLRMQKRLVEAEIVLNGLSTIAPNRSDARIQYGIVLLEMGQNAKAADELRAALAIVETDWAANYYLGWSLLNDKPQEAGQYFERSLELNETSAVRAHLALARIAEQNGKRDLALSHLDAFIALAPNNPDAASARELSAKLRH